jgi:hypothetical protein
MEENKPSTLTSSSSKYYVIGAVVLVVIILLVVLLMGKSKSVAKKNLPENLVGNWVSTVSGKGLQGSGKMTIFNTSNQIDVASDINLTIDKVENNIAYGTVTYNNFCYTTAKITAGKAAAASAPKCTSGISKTIQTQITGNKMTFGAQSILGVDLAYEADFTDSAITGTFSRTGTNQKIDENISGTFNLVRAQK